MSTTVENPLRKALIKGKQTEDDCPHCYGTLKMNGDWRVCDTCHTTPNGVYVDTFEGENTDDAGVITKDERRPRYSLSEKVILAGGFEHAHDIHELEDSLMVTEGEPVTL
jgi:hypothetical protein